MRSIVAIAKRELRAYFGTPIAYVFLAIFVALTGVFAFFHRRVSSTEAKPICGPSSNTTPGSICCWFPPLPCGCGRKSAGPARSSF